jgi:tetratricopeptide (TPR) repeat protein
LPEPQRSQLLCWYGTAAQRQGHTDQAEIYYKSALAHPMVRATALSNLSFLELGKVNISRAAEYIEQALKIDPTHMIALYNYLVVQSLLENEQGCSQAFDRLVQVHPYFETKTGVEQLAADPDLSWFTKGEKFAAILEAASAPEFSGASPLEMLRRSQPALIAFIASIVFFALTVAPNIAMAAASGG